MSTSDSPGPVHHDPARDRASVSSPSADSPDEVPASPGPPPGSIPGQHDEVVEPATHGRHAADRRIDRTVDREPGEVSSPDEPKSPGPTPGTVPGNI
ncbi:hypothetical protein [Georgenia daeguensis]|uniref:Uncharacterized protein n=1 Tax=Georgenia daeguensis TaxID=908355 RepID=A0ABP8EPI7_9MICO